MLLTPRRHSLAVVRAAVVYGKHHGWSRWRTRQDARCCLMTVFVESAGYMYANGNNDRSLQLPHDRVGWDHGSVGLYQQQVGGAPNSTANWGTTDQLMNVAVSTHKFLRALHEHYYEGRPADELDRTPTAHELGVRCQLVQGSAFPDRYAQEYSRAGRFLSYNARFRRIWITTKV